MTSADVNMINDALNDGSKPEDLVTGPSALFMEPPTTSGMDTARRLLSERFDAPTESGRQAAIDFAQLQLISDRDDAPTKRPWWKLW